MQLDLDLSTSVNGKLYTVERYGIRFASLNIEESFFYNTNVHTAYTAPMFRGLGIMHGLLVHSLYHAYTYKGFSTFRLRSVQKAIHLYEKVGFTNRWSSVCDGQNLAFMDTNADSRRFWRHLSGIRINAPETLNLYKTYNGFAYTFFSGNERIGGLENNGTVASGNEFSYFPDEVLLKALVSMFPEKENQEIAVSTRGLFERAASWASSTSVR